METTKAISFGILVLSISIIPSSAQITTACTTSIVTSFTPCMNFITGSTNGGGSPSAGCCKALGSFMSNSMDCACLMFTGNVPFSLPFGQTVANMLPQICNSVSIPLQCKATATPLPSPGPVTYAPGLPPLPPWGAAAGLDVEPPAAAPAEMPASPPAIADRGPSAFNQGQRPQLLPNSAIKLSPALFLVLALGAVLLNKN